MQSPSRRGDVTGQQRNGAKHTLRHIPLAVSASMVRFSASSRSASFSSSTPRPSGSRPVPSCRRRRAARDRSQHWSSHHRPAEIARRGIHPPNPQCGPYARGNPHRACCAVSRVAACWNAEHSRFGTQDRRWLSVYSVNSAAGRQESADAPQELFPQVAPQYGCTIWWRTTSSRTCSMPRRREDRPLTARTLRTQLAFSPPTSRPDTARRRNQPPLPARR